MSVNSIGVLGAGTMGEGIAQTAAFYGFKVVLADIDNALLEKALKSIEKRLSKSVEKGKISLIQKEQCLINLSTSHGMDGLADCDLVIEAILENMDIKKKVFADLDGICKENAVLASNTSSLSITEIAAATKRPDKVIGMHFFNPVPMMQLVEIIKAEQSSDETYNLIQDCCNQMEKNPVLVNEAPLFIVNRLLVPMINEAAFILMQGVADKKSIDDAMKLGANHPIGPFALADLIGIDVVLAVMETALTETGDSKYRACPLLRKMVRAGKLGRKSGHGFYDYV